MSEYIVRFLSYFWDIPIERISSEQNEYLELVWSQGKKVLNTRHANYSFGTDSEVFQEAFSTIPNKLNVVQNVLVLGFACGGIIRVLEDKYQFKGKTTGVEYDASIIAIFERHFKAKHKSQVNLILQDANKYPSKSKEKYDLILVDLFTELKVEASIYDPKYVSQLINLLEPNATIMINLIAVEEQEKERATNLFIFLSTQLKNVNRINVNDLNTIIIGHI